MSEIPPKYLQSTDGVYMMVESTGVTAKLARKIRLSSGEGEPEKVDSEKIAAVDGESTVIRTGKRGRPASVMGPKKSSWSAGRCRYCASSAHTMMLCPKFEAYLVETSEGDPVLMTKLMLEHWGEGDNDEEDESKPDEVGEDGEPKRKKFLCKFCHAKGHIAKTCVLKRLLGQEVDL